MPSRETAPHASTVAPIPTSGLIFVGISMVLGFAYAVACLGG